MTPERPSTPRSRRRPYSQVALVALLVACGGALSSAAPPPPSSGAPVASGAPGGLSWRGEPLRLHATRMQVDLQERQAVLEGAVELHRADLTLRCTRVEFRFDPQGQVTWARATGEVQVEGRDLRARAHEADFSLSPATLWLRGAVSVQRGGVQLTATAASVDLVHQRVELSEVSGAVLAASASAPAVAPSAPGP